MVLDMVNFPLVIYKLCLMIVPVEAQMKNCFLLQCGLREMVLVGEGFLVLMVENPRGHQVRIKGKSKMG